MAQHITETLNEIRNVIYNDSAKNLVNTVRNKDIVMFLGNTRSGKSTVVNHVLGTQLKANKVRNNIYNIVKENPSSTGPAIGAGSVSETSIPSVWTSPKITSLIVDAPGFQDNRGEAQDIANSFYIKEILTNVNSAKFVIISDMNEIVSDNINSFINLIDNVHTMLPLEGKINPGVTMIFNKDRDDLTKEDIVKILKEKVVQQPTIKIANRPLIEYLASNPNQIVIVNMPKTEGTVDDVQIFGNLVANIESNAAKLNKDILASVSPGISDKSRNFLLDARKYFTEINDFDQVMSVVQNNFDSTTLTEFKNVNAITSSSQIPPIKDRLTAVENNVNSIKNPQWSTKETLQRMSIVVPSAQELKEGSSIYTKLEFIKFIDDILKLTESNVFKVKTDQTVAQMLDKIKQCRSALSDRQTALQEEENRIRLQKLKEQQDREAELLRIELERQKQIQDSIIRDPPRPNPVDRIVQNVIVRPAETIYRPVERIVKKCSIM